MSRSRLIILAALLSLIFSGCSGTARLRSFDAMALDGQNVTLQAKLERGRFGKDVRGATISFEILHIPRSAEHKKPVYKKLAEALTDEDGMAEVELEGFFEGAHIIRASYRVLPETKAFSHVFIIPPETPLLVCDIDHTIADVSAIDFLTSAPEDIPALPGSVEALKELSKRYLIVYLTARDDSFLDSTVKWLRIKSFPPGPVFFSDLSKSAWLSSQYAFKSAQLAKWREAGFNLAAGVGDRPEDVRAYLKNGMQAFLVGEHQHVQPGAVAVESWPEIIEALE